MEHDFGTLDYYLHPREHSWRARNPPRAHEPIAWRKLRGKYWTPWTFYGLYSWANIKKWVTRRGDVYQVATANGQITTVKRLDATSGIQH